MSAGSLEPSTGGRPFRRASVRTRRSWADSLGMDALLASGANANQGRLFDGKPGPEVTARVRVTQCLQPDPVLCRYHHTHFRQKGWTCRINTDGLPEWMPPRWIDQDQRPHISPASDSCMLNDDSTAATDGDEHPLPHNTRSPPRFHAFFDRHRSVNSVDNVLILN